MWGETDSGLVMLCKVTFGQVVMRKVGLGFFMLGNVFEIGLGLMKITEVD